MAMRKVMCEPTYSNTVSVPRLVLIQTSNFEVTRGW